MTLIVLQLEQQRHRLLSYISRRDRLGGQAEDILQEVMLKVLEQSRKQEIGNPIAYAYRVADSIIYSNADRAQREAGPPVSDDIASREPLADEVLQHRERVAVFEQALYRLTPLQRRVFILRRFDGRSRTEIAAELGLSVEAVKKHLVRAMAELTGAMDEGLNGGVGGANGEAGHDR